MPNQADSDWQILYGRAEDVAPRLLGSLFIRELNGRRLVGKIVETEAYDQADAASHSYRGNTARTRVMFGPPGHLYVYFTYGMYFCMNVVTEAEGHGAGVLIRALEPIEGEDIMRQNRGEGREKTLMNGPGKLCQALGVTMALGGHDLQEPPLRLVLQPPLAAADIIQTSRVGISAAKDEPWRFYIRGNTFVSRK